MCSFALFSLEMPIILPENHGNIFASLWLIKVNVEYANKETKKLAIMSSIILWALSFSYFIESRSQSRHKMSFCI